MQPSEGALQSDTARARVGGGRERESVRKRERERDRETERERDCVCMTEARDVFLITTTNRKRMCLKALLLKTKRKH